MSELDVREHAQAVRFSVRVQPRAARSGVAGSYGGSLKVRLTAPPVDGAANAALVELLAERLGVPKRDVSIVGGAASRSKVVEVRGVKAELVRSLVSEP